jgi:hypothetical protein
MSEQKPVICPWCGGKMKLSPMVSGTDTGFMELEGLYYTRYGCENPECFIDAPKGDWKATKKAAKEAAYAAATRRPPNLPMAYKTSEVIGDDDPVWIYRWNGEKYSFQFGLDESTRLFCAVNGMYVFAAKPTLADIDAARKAGAHDD